MWSYEKSFTNAQRRHAEETLAIVTQYKASSGDAHPADSASGFQDSHPTAAPVAGAEHSRNDSLGNYVSSASPRVSAAGAPSSTTEPLQQAPLGSGVSQLAAANEMPGPIRAALATESATAGKSGGDDTQKVLLARPSSPPLAETSPRRPVRKKLLLQASRCSTLKRRSTGSHRSGAQPGGHHPPKNLKLQGEAPGHVGGKPKVVDIADTAPAAKTGHALEYDRARTQAVAQKSVSSVAHNSDDNGKTVLLQLRRPHYNAIKDRRKLWEARPLFDGSGRPTIYNKLAVVGNAAVLQSGANTNDRVRIAEVRRYIPDGLSYPLQDMVAELGGDLLPDSADTEARAKIYESLYGIDRCARGFVAMRLEWPHGAPRTANKQAGSGGTATIASVSSMSDVPQLAGPSAEPQIAHTKENLTPTEPRTAHTNGIPNSPHQGKPDTNGTQHSTHERNPKQSHPDDRLHDQGSARSRSPFM